MRKIRARLTYANVMATLAVFVALGGTSYAVVQLPRNSVGAAQIRRDAVGSSELRNSAVSSRSIRDRSIRLRDVSSSARQALRGAKGDPGPKGDAGPAGPSGVSYHAVVNSGGGVVRGNATGASHQGGSGVYTVAFARDVGGCVAIATLAAAQNGPTLEQPAAGRITVGADGARVAVRTFDADGAPRDQPFNVIVVCS
jgi:hypothetical protein